MQTTDLIYPVGTGSHWDNNELRYSLRSVAQNLRGVGKVWIVGERPEWLRGVEHISVQDKWGKANPTANTLSKVLAACDAGISERFIYMNDDFFIMRPMQAENIQPLYKNDLTEWPPSYWNKHPWRQRMLKTMKLLQSTGLKTLCFDIHAPFPMEVTKVRELADRFDWKTGNGLNWRSLYGNVNYPNEAIKNNGKKIVFHSPKCSKEIAETIKGRQFVAVGEKGLNDDMKRMLDYWFRKNCKFEA